MKNYNQAIIYMRLSSDDRNDESLSITNQRSILQTFCENKHLVIIREFVDDGFTGGNFDRPGFTSMINYIQANHVDYVITKDLSRLGRDMSESSYYAERYFPDHGIHYLTVTDGFDSAADNMFAPFQFAMNDVYIRDASRKVKTVLNHKRNRGEYCACPPYGYKKSTRVRGVLEPDENTAGTVRMIFDMAARGVSTRKIADELTAQNIIPPLKYRVEHRDFFGEQGASHATDYWTYTTVKRILRNQVYLGHTLLGKTRKVSPKSKIKVKVAPEEWAVTPNTHEPIVSQEIFDMANRNIDRASRQYTDFIQKNNGSRVSMFRGTVFCATCGSAMCSGGSANWNTTWYLTCLNIPKRSTHRCEQGARIPYHHLVNVVTQELNSLIDLSDDQIDNILAGLTSNQYFENLKEKQEQVVQRATRELADIDRMIEKLYMDNAKGILSDERLSSLIASVEQKAVRCKETIKYAKNKQDEQANATENYKKFFELVKSYSHINELNAEILHMFIDRIEIEGIPPRVKGHPSPEQEIKIFYRFIGDATLVNM